MWQQEKKDNSIVSLALWLALATTPIAANLLVSVPVLAQSGSETPSFPLPQTVENGTTVRIDGSSSLGAINQSLKENFEKNFSGTKVEVATNGTDAGLKALLDGKIDIAAIGRGLTPAEKAQGLEQVRLRREKIAIIIGADNPFKGGLTTRLFARIFRGQITDWSDLGRSEGKIRIIDRPTTSDVRDAFRDYPAFKAAKFATGSNATQLAEDNTAEIVKQLGKDGISYAFANEVSKLKGVRVLQLHQTLPEDPKYPFSQPLVYVYKKNPSPAIAGFLGFTLAQPGQQAIEQARTAQADAIASSVLQTSAVAQTTPITTPLPGFIATPAATASPDANTSAAAQPSVAPVANTPIVDRETPFWLVLPLVVAAIGGFLLWWLRGKRPSQTEQTDKLVESTPSRFEEEAILTAALNGNVAPSFEETIAQEQPLLLEETIAQEKPFPKITAEEVSSHVTSNSAQQATTEGTTLTGAAALAGGATLATGAGAAFWSAISNNGVDTVATDEALIIRRSAQDNPVANGEHTWDIEAPVVVVNNTSYPQLPNIPEETSDLPVAPATEVIASDGELPVSEVTNSVPNVPDWDIEFTEDLTEEELEAESKWLESITSTESDTSAGIEASILSAISENGSQAKVTDETLASSTYVSESSEVISEEELFTAEVTTLISGLLEIPEEALNVVADAAEPTTNVPEEVSPVVPSLGENITEADDPADFAGDAALVAGVAVGAWAGIYGIEANSESNVEAQTDTTVANASLAATEVVDFLNGDEEDSIILIPRTHQWAYVTWYVSKATNEALQQQDGSQLVLRLYDVTNIDISYQIPQLVQQYECERVIQDRFVAIPVSDHDYVTEIGYITDSNRWLFIARSAVVRVFSPPDTDHTLPLLGKTAFGLVHTHDESSITLSPRTPKWAYVSWNISDNQKAALQQSGSQLVLQLYDATDLDLSYQSHQLQLVQQYECQEVTQDRFVAIPVSDRDYVTEIGYVTDGDRWQRIACSPVARVFSRPPGDFWFVADAELIIHGATEPNTTVSIGGHTIKIKPDGTFHLRVPFSDGSIDRLITVVAADGERTRTLHKKFSQETSES